MSAISVADLRLLALGKAVELQRLLEVLVEAEGKVETLTCAASALDRMQDVIGTLTPEQWDVGEEEAQP